MLLHLLLLLLLTRHVWALLLHAEFKDLLKSMLCFDASRRPSAAQALESVVAMQESLSKSAISAVLGPTLTHCGVSCHCAVDSPPPSSCASVVCPPSLLF